MSDERKPMTQEEQDAIKGRLAAITEWPWIAFCRTGVRHRMGITNKRLFDDGDAPEVLDVVELGEGTGGIKSEANAEFIAHAPDDIARLLAEVERLKRVSRYLAERLVLPGPAGRAYYGGEYGAYATKDEAAQSWLDEANREVSNAE
ncbi:hypothetical protein QUW42_09145 [Desulfovibrio piger]|uniref:hypothetical protein n=1 Tax=Desulfovibrio piger TaxID=901 RepID=UPI0025A3615F|nr:hypothetical protein [Desulfovibrio piger]MDM8330449.1 hypothetical protein [Desulfovibrio piger]